MVFAVLSLLVLISSAAAAYWRDAVHHCLVGQGVQGVQGVQVAHQVLLVGLLASDGFITKSANECFCNLQSIEWTKFLAFYGTKVGN
ncbi:hypothetical protein FEM48_Zijuj02G0155900 [Ziziphus jujuba var. spinosa]|uniref:Uncharacterized protein n=1 Tax=Ziziphus jujuba var. spinosa TaxID=714518 RepID=A0A978VWI5_ZIZJJ|nr:hypothetical protein FEM48_Zijuj02G0155900 [Ziziphus jujuba var. spinosa]